MSAITKTLTGSGATAETSSFTYDANGNTTGESTTTYSTETQNGTTFDVRTSLTKAYSYDYTNMMSSATVNESIDARVSGSNDEYTNSASDSASDTYVYNGDGQRVKKITGGITTKYYYTGSVVLYTADADNNKISGNIPTPSGEIIATKDYANATNSDGSANSFANKYYFYHYDIRGSVTTLLKPDATFEQGYSYDEYGNTTVENSASLFHNEMSYTGAISDLTTGLSYMNARYYNPATGTFTSQDTYYGSAYSPWTQHLYSYTMGNPINFIDPTGHRYAEFATMEGEQKKVDPVTSFSKENYDSYKKERDKHNEDYVDAAGGSVSAFAGGLVAISLQGVWDEQGNTASMLSLTFGAELNAGANVGLVITHTNAKNINDLSGISWLVGGSVSCGALVGLSGGYEYLRGSNYTGYNINGGAGISATDVIIRAEGHFAIQLSLIQYFDTAMLDYYAEYGTVEELNQQVEIVSARLKYERKQKKSNK